MKKVLFFTYDFPYPTNTGGKNRAYHLLKHAGEGIELYLFSFIREDFEPRYIENLREIGIKNVELFKRKKVKDPRIIVKLLNLKESIFKSLYFDKEILGKLVQTIELEKIDLVHFESFYTAFYLSESIRKLGVKQVFGTENIEHRLYRDYAKHMATAVLKPFFYLESFKIEHEEKNMIKSADICIAVTEKESEYFERVSGKECNVVENGIDLEFFRFGPQKKKRADTILFVGNFSYFPNRDAIIFFYNNVFKKMGDNLRLIVVGKHVNRLPIRNDQRVERIDYVDDIRDAYKRADALVSPVRIGGGTNFKLLEAMAAGVPVVARPERLEGLGVLPGQHLLTADNSEQFKDQVVKLLNDLELRAHLSKNARKLVEDKFDWRKIGKKLNTIWKNVAK